MTATNQLLELLMDEPAAPAILEKAQQLLQEEQKKRESFYDWVMPDVKAEFINGEIIVHSPVRSSHAMASDNVFWLLSMYALKHKLGRVTHEKVMSRFTRNDYEPDVMFFNNEKAAAIKPNQALFPVPDFVVEILSDATADRDRGVKFKDFEAHQVTEYWIIDPDSQTIEQYVIRNGQYTLVKKSDEGVIHCFVLQGFDFPIEAAFDEQKQFAAVQAMLSVTA